MKIAEITQLTTKEVIEKIEDERVALVRMKLNHSISPLENPMQIRHKRRFVAKLITELRKRNLNEEKNKK